jgi:hypothetical protein
MSFNMRLFVIAMLLGGTVGLSGCNSTPPDPYSNMQMLPPETAGATRQLEDPVLQAEKEHNAQFADKNQRTP